MLLTSVGLLVRIVLNSGGLYECGPLASGGAGLVMLVCAKSTSGLKRIQSGEFVDMGELSQDALQAEF